MADDHEEGGWDNDDDQASALDAMAGGFYDEPDSGNAEVVDNFDPEEIDEFDDSAVDLPAEGDASTAHLDVDREYTGIVVKYFLHKDFGYISCEDIKATTGRDVYVHKNVLLKSRATKGSEVKFTIHLNSHGMPQAQGPMTVLGFNPPAQYSGNIKSFSATNGYGFVASEQIFNEFGRDAFLKLEKAQGYAVGQDVFFNVFTNEKGGPEVSELWPAFGAGGLEPIKGDKGAGKADKGAGKAKGGKSGKASWSAASSAPRDPNWSPPAAFARSTPSAPPPPPPPSGASGKGKGPRAAGTYVRQESRAAVNGGAARPSGGRHAETEEVTDAASAAERLLKAKTYEGVVTTFDNRKGSGWISCDEIKEALGTDCYVHQNVMATSGAFVGARVQFKIHLNPKGQPQAQGPLTVLDGEAPSGYVGVIKSFKDDPSGEKSGYGFVACDETFQEFKRDVFLRKDKAQGFFIGQEVIFNYEVTPDGKPTVSEIWPVSYQAVGKGGRVIGDSSTAESWNSGGGWAADGGWGKGGSKSSKGGYQTSKGNAKGHGYASKGDSQWKGHGYASKGEAKGHGYASKGEAQWNAGGQSQPRIVTSAGGTKRLVTGDDKGGKGGGAWGATKRARHY